MARKTGISRSPYPPKVRQAQAGKLSKLRGQETMGPKQTSSFAAAVNFAMAPKKKGRPNG